MSVASLMLSLMPHKTLDISNFLLEKMIKLALRDNKRTGWLFTFVSWLLECFELNLNMGTSSYQIGCFQPPMCIKCKWDFIHSCIFIAADKQNITTLLLNSPTTNNKFYIDLGCTFLKKYLISAIGCLMAKYTLAVIFNLLPKVFMHTYLFLWLFF